MEGERGLAQSEPRKLLRALAAADPPVPPWQGGSLLGGRACLARPPVGADKDSWSHQRLRAAAVAPATRRPAYACLRACADAPHQSCNAYQIPPAIDLNSYWFVSGGRAVNVSPPDRAQPSARQPNPWRTSCSPLSPPKPFSPAFRPPTPSPTTPSTASSTSPAEATLKDLPRFNRLKATEVAPTQGGYVFRKTRPAPATAPWVSGFNHTCPGRNKE